MRIRLDWQGKGLMPMQMIDTKGLKVGAIPLFIFLQKLREEERDIRYQEAADLLKCSVTTVRNYIQNLVEVGWAKKSADGNVLYLHMHEPSRRKRNGD